MAQFLTVALKATIVISKKRIFNDRIPSEIAIETVENEYDLSLYEYSETEHFHLWKLKNEVLASDIIPLLENVFTLYYGTREGSYHSLIGEIKRKKEYDNIFKLAKEADYEHFELDNKQYTQIHLKKYGKHLQIDYNFIRLFKSDRLRMDNSDSLMPFLKISMQKAFSEFQLSKALDLYVFDEKH